MRGAAPKAAHRGGASGCAFRGVSQRHVGCGPGRAGEAGRLDAIPPQDVKHGLACREQIVGNDAAVTSPPHGLGAHDRAAPFMAQNAQPGEPGTEFPGQGVVGVIVKALILPECVHARGNVVLASAQSAQRSETLVADLILRQRLRQNIAIVLRIGARARDGSHIHHEPDLLRLEQVHELAHRTGRMSDGEERERHVSLAIDQRRMSLSAVPLCRATWSVLSLLISYCGSSLLAWWTYPFQSTPFACTLTTLPLTRPASEFQVT